MSGDEKDVFWGADGCRCGTHEKTHEKTHTRSVLTNLRGTFRNVSPTLRLIFGDAKGKIRRLIGASSANC